MIGVPGREGNRDVQVIIGVDTHQAEHVAVAIDRQGVRLGERHAPATTHGYGELEWWSLSLGEVRAFGIEGTGSYGAGIARFLTGRGYTVVEVNRPDRSMSRVNYICRLASISFAGSPPWPGPVAGQRWSGSWGRQTPG